MLAPLIRPGLPSDIPAIAGIYAEAVVNGTATFELSPPDEAEMARRMSVLQDGGFPYFVAESDGGVAGYAYAGPYRPRPAYRFTVEDSVYLAPAHRGAGLGRALLEAVIGAAETKGFRQMIAVISDETNIGSIALHRACGFSHIGLFRAVGWKHDGWRATVLMQRALGAGDSMPPPDGA